MFLFMFLLLISFAAIVLDIYEIWNEFHFFVYFKYKNMFHMYISQFGIVLWGYMELIK